MIDGSLHWGKCVGGRELAQKDALTSHPLLIVEQFAAFVFILLLAVVFIPIKDSFVDNSSRSFECVTYINEANFALIISRAVSYVSVCSFLFCFWRLSREGYPIVSIWLYFGVCPSSFASFSCHVLPSHSGWHTT